MLTAIFTKFKESPRLLFIVILLLTAVGLASIYSVSQHQELPLLQTTFFRQCLWLLPALIVFFSMFLLFRKHIHKYSRWAYGVTILLLLLPFFRAPVAGTYRWIHLGPINFQPSEYAKIFLILVLARYLSSPKLRLERFPVVIIPLVITLIPTLIVLKQPDLGTAIIMVSPVLAMMYWAGIRPFYLFLLAAPVLSIITAFHPVTFWIWALLLLLVLYLARPTLVTGVAVYFSSIFLGLLAPTIWGLLKPYQQRRFLVVLDPSLDPLGAGYQIIQSQTAIGSGGFFGKGWGQGTQTQMKYLPVQETDFIVSVIGEEFGFIVIVVLLVLFAWLFVKMLRLATESDNRFSSLVIVGVAVLLLMHVFVNMAMAVGLIPVKGLPLPFVSYGGSFLLSCYMMVGIVMNLSINYSE